MRVAYNARLLHAPTLRGWNRYTINLLAELGNLGVELMLYSDRPVHPDHLARLPAGSYHVRVASPMRYVRWEQRWLPRQCAADRVDLLHTPFNFGLPWTARCPRILTLHDAVGWAYQQPSWLRRVGPTHIRVRVSHWVARVSAARIITPSNHAKGELIKHLSVQAEKITVIPEAADPRFHAPVPDERRTEVRQRYGLQRPYAFYVGGWEDRKNLPFLVRAFAQAGLEDVELVLAGGDDADRAPIGDLAHSLGIEDRVRLLGWIEDQDLPALYAGALCFVYPSTYEGFGLQLCEAMAVGCPTIAARATSLPEVLGDGGETFSLTDLAELAGLLRRIATDAGYRTELSRRARQRAARYSWADTAQRTLKLYRSVLGGRA